MIILKFNSLKRVAFVAILFFLSLVSYIFADVNSVTGTIHFDSNNDSNYEMSLTSTGLGIGTSSPNTNLHLVGNAVITNGSLSIGSQSGNSTLFVQGSIGYSVETTNSNLTLGDVP